MEIDKELLSAITSCSSFEVKLVLTKRAIEKVINRMDLNKNSLILSKNEFIFNNIRGLLTEAASKNYGFKNPVPSLQKLEKTTLCLRDVLMSYTSKTPELFADYERIFTKQDCKNTQIMLSSAGPFIRSCEPMILFMCNLKRAGNPIPEDYGALYRLSKTHDIFDLPNPLYSSVLT
jgi:hypothetical protein